MLSSSSAGPRDGTFSLYLHPAAVEVLYTGVVKVGFLSESRATPVTLQINQKVPKTSGVGTPISAIVVGSVASKPGEYSVVIQVEALPAGRAKVILNENVTVTVKSPEP